MPIVPADWAFLCHRIGSASFSQIIGGLAYFTLYFRVSDVTQKYRILLVSWSIIIWFLSPYCARAGGLAEQDWWQLASRLIGLAAALTILMAYLPPRWLKQRYGIVSLMTRSSQTESVYNLFQWIFTEMDGAVHYILIGHQPLNYLG